MLKNYLSTLLRQMLKFKSSYSVNILGLACGLACCLICYTHIRQEFSFDRFHADADRTYRLVTGDPATTDSWVKIAAPISPKLKADIPEIESYLRLGTVTWNEKVLVESEGKFFLEPGFMMADPVFFNFFNFPLLKGDPALVLSDQNNVVISETIARKLFGERDPLGKIIQLKDNKLDFQVAGIMKDLPLNTHLHCDYLVSFENLERVFGKGRREAWGEFNYFAYLKLQSNALKETVEAKIRSIAVELPNNKLSFENFHLQPITAIHFEDNRGNILPSYDIRYIYIFATLSLCVLIISAMNYFNVAAMLSIKRIREIGVRKSVGASNRQLNVQFLSESLGITLFSFLMSLVLVELIKPFASTLLASPVQIPYAEPSLILFSIVIILTLGLASGAYLTFYVNRFRPGSILKGNLGGSGKKNSFQHSLIFIQFCISIVLLISSFVIVRQMQFLRDKDLGFDQEQVISIALPKDVPVATLTSLQTELINSVAVEDAALSDFVPGRVNWHQTTWWEGQVEEEYMYVIAIGKDFIPAMKIKLVEGSLEEITSSTEIQYIINESALRQIGWSGAKGKFISPFGEARKKGITGVVKDFNYRSLHNEIAPLVLVVYPERNFSQLTVRLKEGQLKEGIENCEQLFKSVTGGLPFEYSFLDDRINKLYESELRMENTVVILTFIAVAFALLGIYTLISFTIENRTKEIAIRKVLGVSSESLITLFTGTYFKIALLASLIAIPVCWKLLNEWLARFNEHVVLSFFGFLPVVLVMLLLVGVVGFSKYLAINRINPARSLKSE